MTAKPSIAVLVSGTGLKTAYMAGLMDSLSSRFAVETIHLNDYVLRENTQYALKTKARHLSEISAALQKHSLMIVSVDVGQFGSHITHARRNFLHLIDSYKGKILFFMDSIPTDNFSLFFRSYGIISQYKHRWRGEFRKLLQDWITTRNTDRIWESTTTKMRAGSADIVAFNKYKLDLWKRVHAFREGLLIAPVFFTEEERKRRTGPETKQRLRAKLGVKPGDIFITAVGDITERNGLKTLVRAFANLPDSYRVTICGNNRETVEYREMIESRSSHRDVYIDVLNRRLRGDMKTEDLQEHYIPNRLGSLAQLFGIINRQGRKINLDTLQFSDLCNLTKREEALPRLLDEIGLALPDPVDQMRVRFLKPESMEASFEIMAAADACVFCDQETDAVHNLYLAAAVELNAHVFVSYNSLHREFERFYPGKLTFFDVGNDLELAQKLARLPRDSFLEPPVATGYPDAAAQAENIRAIIERLLAA